MNSLGTLAKGAVLLGLVAGAGIAVFQPPRVAAPAAASVTDDGTLYVRPTHLVLSAAEAAPGYELVAEDIIAPSPITLGGITRVYEPAGRAGSPVGQYVLMVSVSPNERGARAVVLGKRTVFETATVEEGDVFGVPQPLSGIPAALTDGFAFRLPGLDGSFAGVTLIFRRANVVYEIVAFGDPVGVTLAEPLALAERALRKLAQVVGADPGSLGTSEEWPAERALPPAPRHWDIRGN